MSAQDDERPESTTSSLNPGNPLGTIKHDLLGREPWVKNLAQLITNHPGGDSLTIAIYGKWGSGKSTLLNFVIEELEKPEHRESLVVGRFNPWNFSQQDRLYSTFFATTGALLKKADTASRVKNAAELLDALAVLTAPVSLVPVWGSIVPDSIKKLSGVGKGYANIIGDVEHVKKSISKTLQDSRKRLVIIIDDIDRLTVAEIRQVFQLVKSMADFQNVVYVLAFDHDTVSKALDGVTDNKGDEYLEKITNVVLTAPMLTAGQVRKLVYKEIKSYADRQREYNWDTDRVRDIIDVANRSFTTIRQVYRFGNALAATEQMTATDVDFADHIALTMLQTFEPRVHQFIGAHPELFVDDLLTQLARRDEQDVADKAAIEERLNAVSGMSREDLRQLLEAVFPKMRRLYSQGSKEWGKAEWRTEGRACADFRTLSRYFVFQVDESDLSAAEKDSLWQSTGAVETFEAYLKHLHDEKSFSAFEYLKDTEASTLADEQVRVIVEAIVDIGDEMRQLQGLDDMFRGPFLEAVRALRVMLESRPQPLRFEMALEALRRPPQSLEMPAQLAYALAGSRFGLFSEEQRAQLVEACAQLLKTAWLDGRLVKHSRFIALFADWLGRDGEPNRDVVQAIRETLGTDDARFLEVIGRYENVRSARYEPDRFLTTYLSKIYSLEELRDRLGAMSGKPEFEAEYGRIRELVAEVERQIKAHDASLNSNADLPGSLLPTHDEIQPGDETIEG